MKKRKIIVACCIIGIIVIVAGVFAAMFNLQHISVEIRKNPEIVEQYGKNVESSIIECGDFPYGSNTLFSSYVKNQDRIEKEFPFIKVEKMVRRFPDKMTIYISGRVPEVIVKDNSKVNTYYVLDIDMKVLAVIGNDELDDKLYKNLPILTGSSIKNMNSGEFLTRNNETSVIVSILDGIYAKDQTESSVMSDITIDLSKEKYIITLKDSNVKGAVIEINGNDNLKEKVFAAYSLYKIVENDSNYPDKNKMYFLVGKDFTNYGLGQKVIMKYDGVEV